MMFHVAVLAALASTLAACAASPEPNTLTDAQKADGWILLFDGSSTEHFRGFRKDAIPEKGWVVEEGALKVQKGGGGGDLVTKATFDHFEFRCEWKVAEGANSGIMYRVDEEGNYPWLSGPEMQILDDEHHPDGRSPLTSAGALYALIPSSTPNARPVGEWNSVRIVCKPDGTVEHWMNGAKIVEYQWGSDDIREKIAASKFSTMPRFMT
ncbi:MAG: DUF1080 domain-containing protein, partial [Phycisphaerales bacterium]|nr:DUF1080 domain-containing protein [Phycisphaerales bacterium]